jgi:hypothetical protein
MNKEEISASIKRTEGMVDHIKDTEFHSMDFTVHSDLAGRALMMRVQEIATDMDVIVRKLPKFKYLLAIYEARYKESWGKATSIVMGGFGDKKVSAKERDEKILFCEVVLSTDKDKTTPYSEYMKKNSLSYIVDTGEQKLRLAEKMLDFARSMLSFNKSEIER